MLQNYKNYKILNFFKNQKIILLAITLFSLTSCVETIVISTGVGAGLAYREKTIDDTRSDLKISTKIALKFIAKGLKNPGNSIDITVNEGRVMLTGIARNPAKAKLAQELCWQVKGVNEVIDEIQIPDDANAAGINILLGAAEGDIVADDGNSIGLDWSRHSIQIHCLIHRVKMTLQ